VSKARGINKMTTAGPSPEKAGVGGSIPSLATIFKHLQAKLSGVFETEKTVRPLEN